MVSPDRMDLIVEYLNIEGFNGKGIAELVPDIPGFLASQGIAGPYVGSQGDFSGKFDNTNVSKTINGNSKTGFIGMHNDTEVQHLCFTDYVQANEYTSRLMTKDPIARGTVGGRTGSGAPKRNLSAGNFNHNGAMASNILSIAQSGAPTAQFCTDVTTVLGGTDYDQVFSLLPFQYAVGSNLVHPLAPVLAGGAPPATPPPAPTPKAASKKVKIIVPVEPEEEEEAPVLALPPSGDTSDQHIIDLFQNEKPQYKLASEPKRTLSKKSWKERRDAGNLQYPYPGAIYITFQPHPQDSELQPTADIVMDASNPTEFARVSNLADQDEAMELMGATYMDTPYVTLKFQPNVASTIILHSTVNPDQTSQIYPLYDVKGKPFKPLKDGGIQVEWDFDAVTNQWSVKDVVVHGKSKGSSITIKNNTIESNCPDTTSQMIKAGPAPITWAVNPWDTDFQCLPAANPLDFQGGLSADPEAFNVQLTEPLIVMGVGDKEAGGLRGFPENLSYTNCNNDTAELQENLQKYYAMGNRLLYLSNIVATVTASPDVYAGVTMTDLNGDSIEGDDLLVRPPVTADKVLWSKSGSEEGYATVSVKLLTPNATDRFPGRDSRKVDSSAGVDETLLLPNDLTSIWPAQAPFNKKNLMACSILDIESRNPYKQLTEIRYSTIGNRGDSLDEEGNKIPNAMELDPAAPGVLECVFSDGSTWQIPNSDLDVGAIGTPAHDITGKGPLSQLFFGRVTGIHIYNQTKTDANAAHALLEADRRERMLNSDYNLTVSEEIDGDRREKTVTDCLAFQKGEVYYIVVGDQLIVLNMGVGEIPPSLTPAMGLQPGGATPEQIQATQEALEASAKTEAPPLTHDATVTEMDEAMTANNEEVATPSEPTEEGGAEPPAMVQVEVDGELEVVPEEAVEAVAEEADEEAQEVLEEMDPQEWEHLVDTHKERFGETADLYCVGCEQLEGDCECPHGFVSMTDEEIDADLHEEMSTPDYGFTEEVEPIEVEGVEITEEKIEADLPIEASLDELDALITGGEEE